MSEEHENAMTALSEPAPSTALAIHHLLGTMGLMLALMEGMVASRNVHFAAAQKSLENARKALVG